MTKLNKLINGSKANMEFTLSEMEDKSGGNSIIFSNSNSVETDASKFLLITGLSSVSLVLHPVFVILPIIGGILSYQVLSTVSLLERKSDEVVFTKFRWGKPIMKEIYSIDQFEINFKFPVLEFGTLGNKHKISVKKLYKEKTQSKLNDIFKLLN